MNDRLESAEPIPIAQFEGEIVRTMEGKLPAISLEMPEGYARGTHLKMEIEVRVRNVRYEEIARGPNKGELVRQHIFALEEGTINLIGAFTPDEVDPGVGGSASLSAVRAEDEAEEAQQEDDDELVVLCGAGVGGGEVCFKPRDHDGDHDPDYDARKESGGRPDWVQSVEQRSSRADVGF